MHAFSSRLMSIPTAAADDDASRNIAHIAVYEKGMLLFNNNKL